MKFNALLRCPVIVAVAALAVSISVSGCQSTAVRQIAGKTDQPPGEALPSAGEDALGRALSLATEERHLEAREILDPLLEQDPDNTRARLLHGVLRAHEGRVADAIEIFEQLKRDNPDLPEPYNNLAVLYTVEGRLDDARRVLLESLERRPDPITYASLGEVYTKLARDANERARELDAGVLSSSNRATTRVAGSSETSADLLQTDAAAQ